MKKYCLIYTEYRGIPLGDPAIIPSSTLKKGYNLLEIFGIEEVAPLESAPSEEEIRFFFCDTGYAIPQDGETYATQWHTPPSHPEGMRLLVCLTDDVFQ